MLKPLQIRGRYGLDAFWVSDLAREKGPSYGLAFTEVRWYKRDAIFEPTYLFIDKKRHTFEILSGVEGPRLNRDGEQRGSNDDEPMMYATWPESAKWLYQSRFQPLKGSTDNSQDPKHLEFEENVGREYAIYKGYEYVPKKPGAEQFDGFVEIA